MKTPLHYRLALLNAVAVLTFCLIGVRYGVFTPDSLMPLLTALGLLVFSHTVKNS